MKIFVAEDIFTDGLEQNQTAYWDGEGLDTLLIFALFFVSRKY